MDEFELKNRNIYELVNAELFLSRGIYQNLKNQISSKLSHKNILFYIIIPGLTVYKNYKKNDHKTIKSKIPETGFVHGQKMLAESRTIYPQKWTVNESSESQISRVD